MSEALYLHGPDQNGLNSTGTSRTNIATGMAPGDKYDGSPDDLRAAAVQVLLYQSARAALRRSLSAWVLHAKVTSSVMLSGDHVSSREWVSRWEFARRPITS